MALRAWTLTSLLPGNQFQITEVFVFQGGTHPPFAQGDVGAMIETTMVNQMAPVPGPIVGAGLPGLLASLFGGGWWWRRRRNR